MSTPEQQIIAKLHYMGRQYGNGQMARGGPSGKHYLTEAAEMLESLIAERDALKAELAAIKGAGEPSTRPAVPLTDEQIDELAVKHQHFVTTSDGQTHEQFEIFEFARAIEAKIKGA